MDINIENLSTNVQLIELIKKKYALIYEVKENNISPFALFKIRLPEEK